MIIDIVTTSTIRPEIIDKTYASFTKYLLKNMDDYRLLINVDPIGDKKSCQDDVLRIAKKYFKNVIYNFPDKPSFTKSVIWLWSHTTSDYVFHLEDDWVILQSVDINDMINLMNKYSKLCAMRLSKGTMGAGGKILKSFPCSYVDSIDKKKFQLFPRISLNPSLFRGEFVRGSAKIMTPDINPESQLVKGWARKHRDFDSSEIDRYLEGWDYGVYTAVGSSPLVSDIGRKWRLKMNVKRNYDFVYWG
jgi:hypothetical protein